MHQPALRTDIPFLAFFGYQEMFAIITPALITGAFADRVTFKAYLLFLIGGVCSSTSPSPTGSGAAAFAAVGPGRFCRRHRRSCERRRCGAVLGHRCRPPTAQGRRKSTPHNIAFVALGTGLLWFGWFGFNGGSALAANGVAAAAFVNTDIAGSIAMIVWLAIAWVHDANPP